MAIYTLGQNGTGNYPGVLRKPAININGHGSELGNDKVSKGWAKRKFISQVTALSLATIAEKKDESEKIKSFWNTYHCQNTIYTFEGRKYGKYCKNRHCTLCSSIRKAEILNRYLPIVSEWPDPQFLTLTIKTCNLLNLENMMKGMIRAFRQINAKIRKRHQRGSGFQLIGIKALECVYNPLYKKYHPHFHLIVANKKMAEVLVAEWLRKWTSKYTDRKGQYYRPAGDIENDMIQTVKYGSKIFTEPDVNKKSGGQDNSELYAVALYNALGSMKGLRIFERFGFNLPNAVKERMPSRSISDYYEWEFVMEHFDWLNTDNELTLSGYKPKPELLNLLENRINMESE